MSEKNGKRPLHACRRHGAPPACVRVRWMRKFTMRKFAGRRPKVNGMQTTTAQRSWDTNQRVSPRLKKALRSSLFFFFFFSGGFCVSTQKVSRQRSPKLSKSRCAAVYRSAMLLRPLLSRGIHSISSAARASIAMQVPNVSPSMMRASVCELQGANTCFSCPHSIWHIRSFRSRPTVHTTHDWQVTTLTCFRRF